MRRATLGLLACILLVTMVGCGERYQTKAMLPQNLVHLAENQLQETYDEQKIGQNPMPGSQRVRPETGKVMFVYPEGSDYTAWLTFEGYGNVLCYFSEGDGGWTFEALDSIIVSNYTLPEPFTGVWTADAEIPKAVTRAPDILWGMVGSDKTASVHLQGPLYDCSIPEGNSYIENGYYVVPFKHGAVFYVQVVFEDASGNVLKTIECKGAAPSP